MVELQADTPRILLRALPIQADTSGGVPGCGEALDDKPATADGFGSADCADVTGHWRLEARAAPARADIVVTFGGKTASRNDATGAVTSRTIAETLVLRDAGDGYAPLSGSNPTPGL